jgi:surface polysaccharide O-acyltransferase-like enzyme
VQNWCGGGKLVYIAALNVLGALGVVLLHANNVFWSRPKGTLWLSANLIETFFYWPVPIFFMITGATLIDYLKSTAPRFISRSVL